MQQFNTCQLFVQIYHLFVYIFQLLLYSCKQFVYTYQLFVLPSHRIKLIASSSGIQGWVLYDYFREFLTPPNKLQPKLGLNLFQFFVSFYNVFVIKFPFLFDFNTGFNMNLSYSSELCV